MFRGKTFRKASKHPELVHLDVCGPTTQLQKLEVSTSLLSSMIIASRFEFI